MANRRKILFVAYYYPPFKGIASIRTGNIAFYLNTLGWDVSVVTPDPNLWVSPDLTPTYNSILLSRINHIFTGHRLRCLNPLTKSSEHKLLWLAGVVMRKIASALGLDASLGWEFSTSRLIPRICQDKYDVVLASGGPFSTFRIAERIAKKINIPLILDYRDGWTRGNPHGKKRPWEAVDHLLEKKIVSEAAMLITVSPGLKSIMIKNFHVTSKIHVIENGFNPSELKSIIPTDFGHLAIVYAGNFYPPKRTIAPIFTALKSINDRKYDVPDNWRFHYFGDNAQMVKIEAAKNNLFERVIIHDFVPREQALSAIKASQVSIVITTISKDLFEDESCVLPGKIFELIGLGARILLVTPHGSDAEAIIRSTGLGECYDGEEVNLIADYICRCLNEKKPEFIAVDYYSWPKLSLRLDALLSTLQ